MKSSTNNHTWRTFPLLLSGWWRLVVHSDVAAVFRGWEGLHRCIPDVSGCEWQMFVTAKRTRVVYARACRGLHGHVHLRVFIVTLALVKLWLCVVRVQLEETESWRNQDWDLNATLCQWHKGRCRSTVCSRDLCALPWSTYTRNLSGGEDAAQHEHLDGDGE